MTDILSHPSPHDVACPRCGAAPGENCVGKSAAEVCFARVVQADNPDATVTVADHTEEQP